MNFLNYIFGRDPDKKDDEKFRKEIKKKMSEDRQKAMNRRSFLTGLAVTPLVVKSIIDEQPKIPREEAGFELDKSITNINKVTCSIPNYRSYYLGSCMPSTAATYGYITCGGNVSSWINYDEINNIGINNSKF